MRVHRSVIGAAGGLALALVAASCDVSTNEEPVAVRGAFEQIVQSTTTSSTTAPEADARPVQVYFVRSGEGTIELVAADREVPPEAGVEQVLALLFAGPPPERGLTNAVPPDAVLLGARILADSPRVEVNTQGLFGQSGVQGTQLRNALGQIVCTATQLSSVDEVVFQNEGRSVSATIEDGGSVDRAVRCDDYNDLT